MQIESHKPSVPERKNKINEVSARMAPTTIHICSMRFTRVNGMLRACQCAYILAHDRRAIVNYWKAKRPIDLIIQMRKREILGKVNSQILTPCETPQATSSARSLLIPIGAEVCRAEGMELISSLSGQRIRMTACHPLGTMELEQ
jgi:hypothetical protein